MGCTRSSSFLFVAIIAFSPLVFSETEMQLDADAISKIRSVSQGLLKVRGQQRQAIQAETNDIRIMIKGVNDALDVASAELEKPIIEVPKASGTDEKEIDKAGRASGSSLFNFFRNKPNSEKPAQTKHDTKFYNSLTQAKDSLTQRKNIIANRQPKSWELWRSKSESDEVLVENIESIIHELNDISEENTAVRQAKLEKLKSRLRGSKSVSGRRVAEPTISTITKHYR